MFGFVCRHHKERPHYVVSSPAPRLLDGLTTLIEREAGGKVVSRARSLVEAAQRARQLRPEAIVIEVRAFDPTAAGILRNLRSAVPGISTVLICLGADASVRQLAREAGVTVLVDDLDTFNQFVPALKRLTNGQTQGVH